MLQATTAREEEEEGDSCLVQGDSLFFSHQSDEVNELIRASEHVAEVVAAASVTCPISALGPPPPPPQTAMVNCVCVFIIIWSIISTLVVCMGKHKTLFRFFFALYASCDKQKKC